MPVEVVEAVAAREVRVSAHEALDEVIAEADVVYVTRVQRERFADPAAFQAVRGSYIVDTAVMAKVCAPPPVTRSGNKSLLSHAYCPRVRPMCAARTNCVPCPPAAHAPARAGKGRGRPDAPSSPS